MHHPRAQKRLCRMRSPLVRSSGAVAEHATPSLGATRDGGGWAGRLPYACSSLFAAVSERPPCLRR